MTIHVRIPHKRTLVILSVLDLLTQALKRLKTTFDESNGMFGSNSNLLLLS